MEWTRHSFVNTIYEAWISVNWLDNLGKWKIFSGATSGHHSWMCSLFYGRENQHSVTVYFSNFPALPGTTMAELINSLQVLLLALSA